MDGESFDRLSVVVHRLRDQASRRSAFRLLLGGALVGAGALAADDTDAKKKNKNRNKNARRKRCRGYGAGCGSNRDCCNGKCRNGRCWYTGNGGGGGGRNCGGAHCPNGWRCRSQAGVHVCVPNNFPTYCDGKNWYTSDYRCCDGIPSGACRAGNECCGGAGQCCQNGWKCCSGRTCIPNDWDCNDFTRQSAAGDVAIAAEGRIPSMEPTPVPESDYITIDPGA